MIKTREMKQHSTESCVVIALGFEFVSFFVSICLFFNSRIKSMILASLHLVYVDKCEFCCLSSKQICTIDQRLL